MNFVSATAKKFFEPKKPVKMDWIELRAKAKAAKIEGYQRMKRDELERALRGIK